MANHYDNVDAQQSESAEEGHPVNDSSLRNSEEGEDKEEEENHLQTLPNHLRSIASLTGPIILSEIFQNALPIVDIAFVGRLTSKEELAAAALATVWFNLWNATMLGFCTAVDTLLSQSYGADKLRMFAIWTGNSLVIVSLVSLIVGGLVALCDPMMVLFGQDPALAYAAGQFSYRLLPGLLPYYVFKVLVKHLQAQNILVPGAFIGLVANAINVVFNWLFISRLNMGLNGAPIATTMTRVLELILILFYFYWHKSGKLAKTWPSFQVQNFNRETITIFLKMAITSALSFTAEAWSFEITTILAGLLGTVALDAHIVTLSVATFIYLSFPFAIGLATSIRVGQLIGEGKVEDAKRSSIVSFILTLIVQILLIIGLLIANEEITSLFSNDEEVTNLMKELIPLSCIFMLGDAIQSNIGGVFRGLGQPKLLLLLNVIGFWILALPSGAVLTFPLNVGVKGLWLGMTVGIYSSSLVGLVLLKFKVDWNNEAKLAQERITSANNNNQG